MRKKVFALVLAALMAAALLAGCNGGGGPASTPQASTPASSGGALTDDPVSAGNGETMTIRIAWMDSSTFGQDNIATTLEEKFNVKFEFVNLSWADYVEKLNTMVGSGDVPDIFVYPAVDDPNTKPVYFKWIEQGVLKALPDDLSPYPTIAAIMSEYDLFQVNGKNYQIPRLAYDPEYQHYSQGMLARTDFMEKAGVTEAPTTIDAFYDMLVALKNADIGGATPLSIHATYAGFLENAFGAPTYAWVEEDGQVIPASMSKNYLECVKFLSKCYGEGLIDPDFATQNADQMHDKFVNGKIACITGQFEAQSMQLNLTDKMSSLYENADQLLGLVPIVSGPMGDVVMTNQYNHWSGTLFSGQLDDAKMARCMEIFDYCLTEEGLDLFRWGIEGEDYEVVDGTYESLLPVDEATGLPPTVASIKPTANLKLLFSWDINGVWGLPSMPQNLIAIEQQHIEIYQDRAQEGAISGVPFISDPDLDNFSYMDLVETFYAKAIMGQYNDIDAEFERLKEEIMTTRGGTEAIAAATAYVNAG